MSSPRKTVSQTAFLVAMAWMWRRVVVSPSMHLCAVTAMRHENARIASGQLSVLMKPSTVFLSSVNRRQTYAIIVMVAALNVRKMPGVVITMEGDQGEAFKLSENKLEGPTIYVLMI